MARSSCVTLSWREFTWVQISSDRTGNTMIAKTPFTPFSLAALSLWLCASCSSAASPKPQPHVAATPSETEGDSELVETSAAASSCTIPSAAASTPEETAWRIFVAINCKNPAGQLTWETWTDQACLDNPDDCPAGRLHGSIAAQLARSETANNGPKRTGGCEAMTTASSSTPKGLLPFVPSNLSQSPVFCEEVTVNDAELNYGKQNGLLTVQGQMAYLKAGNAVAFPTPAIEVKADWVPAASFTNANFDCTQPSSDVYLEEIQGTCYALAGMHISSKLYPKWLWATFEPQYAITNPNRCKSDLYGSCNDSWGSSPPSSTGQPTSITPALQSLFTGAGTAFTSSFSNYRLTGVQTEFSEPQINHGQLGSSFVEFNAEVPPGQASCITCHSYAQRTLVDGGGFKAGQTPPGGPYVSTDNSVGTPSAPPAGTDFKSLDFSWFLGFGVPN